LRLLNFSLDARANVLSAACGDGKLRLYDLAAVRAATSTHAVAAARAAAGFMDPSLVRKGKATCQAAGGARPPSGKSRVQPIPQHSNFGLKRLKFEELHQLAAHTFSFPVADQDRGDAAAARGPGNDSELEADAGVLRDSSNTIAATVSRQKRATGAKKQQIRDKAAGGVGGGKQLAARALDVPAAALNRRKLQQMLLVYGEFPARYRLLIW
jgi:hypothetical protein